MKKLILLSILFVFASCDSVTDKSDKDEKKSKKDTELSQNEAKNSSEDEENQGKDYETFGGEIDQTNFVDAKEITEKYKAMQPGDSIQVKFKSKVNSVCKKKGCWMKLAMEDSLETMVRFRDYSFFVPKDIQDRTVIVEGVAFVEETSVGDLRHFAEDDGKSKEEIEAITEPQKTYAFTADAVLLEEE
ncbi:MAG: DUF4920 domain-containing protein [Bacteroidota bacterium]